MTLCGLADVSVRFSWSVGLDVVGFCGAVGGTTKAEPALGEC